MLVKMLLITVALLSVMIPTAMLMISYRSTVPLLIGMTLALILSWLNRRFRKKPQSS
jgi:predicted PurR-regulated permease PerM